MNKRNIPILISIRYAKSTFSNGTSTSVPNFFLPDAAAFMPLRSTAVKGIDTSFEAYAVAIAVEIRSIIDFMLIKKKKRKEKRYKMLCFYI